jgi:hypothetical protein
VSRPRAIDHVTIDSGHRRMSERSEIADDVVEVLRGMIERIVEGETVALPQPGYVLSGARAGRCLIVTLWGHTSDTARPERVPVMTMGVGAHSRCAATLWRALHDGPGRGPAATDPGRPPRAPWCGDRLEIGAMLMQEALHWTGDLSRCIAWTWLEMREQARRSG